MNAEEFEKKFRQELQDALFVCGGIENLAKELNTNPRNVKNWIANRSVAAIDCQEKINFLARTKGILRDTNVQPERLKFRYKNKITWYYREHHIYRDCHISCQKPLRKIYYYRILSLYDVDSKTFLETTVLRYNYWSFEEAVLAIDTFQTQRLKELKGKKVEIPPGIVRLY